MNSPSRHGDEQNFQSEQKIILRDESGLSLIDKMQSDQQPNFNGVPQDTAVQQTMDDMVETNPVAVYHAMKEMLFAK